MQIIKGRDRIVFIFPLLGIAVKFPVIHFFAAIKPFFYRFPKGKRGKYLKRHVFRSSESNLGVKGLLFKGVFANWCEFWLYLKTQNTFLQPTYFSLFGLLNIQRHGELCRLKEINLWCQLSELTNGKVFDDPHHFSNPRNFCLCGRKLRIFDYGSCRSHDVIIQYGAKIVDFFNPMYCWEEEENKRKKKRESTK